MTASLAHDAPPQQLDPDARRLILDAIDTQRTDAAMDAGAQIGRLAGFVLAEAPPDTVQKDLTDGAHAITKTVADHAASIEMPAYVSDRLCEVMLEAFWQQALAFIGNRGGRA